MVYIKRYRSMMKQQSILAFCRDKEERRHLILDTNKQILSQHLIPRFHKNINFNNQKLKEVLKNMEIYNDDLFNQLKKVKITIKNGIIFCNMKIIKINYPKSNSYCRIVWFILFCGGVYYGYLLYTPILHNWFYHPTVHDVEKTDFYVKELPFPSVTICSNNKIVKRQLESVLLTQPWKGYNKKIENFDKRC